MASAVSYEYLIAKKAVANGFATLDATTKMPEDQLPTSAVQVYKGNYADDAAIIAAHATGTLAEYAYNQDTSSHWYWNAEIGTPAWVNQQITEVAYNALSTAEKAAVPYIVIE